MRAHAPRQVEAHLEAMQEHGFLRPRDVAGRRGALGLLLEQVRAVIIVSIYIYGESVLVGQFLSFLTPISSHRSDGEAPGGGGDHAQGR